jgi:hypothetical protein
MSKIIILSRANNLPSLGRALKSTDGAVGTKISSWGETNPSEVAGRGAQRLKCRFRSESQLHMENTG